MFKLTIISCLLLLNSAFAFDYDFNGDRETLKLNSNEEMVFLSQLKLNASFLQGQGDLSIKRSKENKHILEIIIKGNISSRGDFLSSINYEEFKKGVPLKFYIEGKPEPRMIIEPKVETLDDVKGGLARILYLTPQGYKGRAIKIWPDAQGKMRLWDMGVAVTKEVNLLIVKINPFNMLITGVEFQ